MAKLNGEDALGGTGQAGVGMQKRAMAKES